MPEPFRLALIITELDVGGAERCLVNLACGIDRDRFEPVVYALGPPPAQRQLVDQLEAGQVPVRFVGATSVWGYQSARRRLQAWLTQQQPHLVQTFLFHANFLGTMAALRANVPFRVLGIRVADPARWRQWLERYAARYAQRVVCVSQAVADFAAQRGLPRHKLVVIANGIDSSRYPAQTPADLGPLGIAAGRRVILYAGRLHPQKGLDWLLELVPEMMVALPQHDLLLVGAGPQRRALESRAQELGVSHRVHFAGWRPDLPEILRASDLLVLPSRWEGMPNVLLEAMASQRPLVATQTPGVGEILGPLCDSQVVEFGNRDQFLARVTSICRNAEMAEKLGAANRQRVQQHFALQTAIAAYQSLYESLLEGFDVNAGRSR